MPLLRNWLENFDMIKKDCVQYEAKLSFPHVPINCSATSIFTVMTLHSELWMTQCQMCKKRPLLALVFTLPGNFKILAFFPPTWFKRHQPVNQMSHAQAMTNWISGSSETWWTRKVRDRLKAKVVLVLVLLMLTITKAKHVLWQSAETS